ncbi:electron transfer flavoprotein-ubiquinone mitochondrial precursor [Brettanomyces bruxellensis AWRI1499]|nr:electron transfer flavoprotein-ubiquinone mitochondrial precursor [Brettanomyces bruxellensis AWRI1499]
MLSTGVKQASLKAACFRLAAIRPAVGGIKSASANFMTVETSRCLTQNRSFLSARFQPVRTFTTTRSKLAEVAFEKLTEDQKETLTEERAIDNVDVCIVGAGPAGLATAIKLKQLDEDGDLRVIVLEKGPEVGAHILSGAVLDPKGLRELFSSERILR